jgi:hypothetical protein
VQQDPGLRLEHARAERGVEALGQRDGEPGVVRGHHADGVARRGRRGRGRRRRGARPCGGGERVDPSGAQPGVARERALARVGERLRPLRHAVAEQRRERSRAAAQRIVQVRRLERGERLQQEDARRVRRARPQREVAEAA